MKMRSDSPFAVLTEEERMLILEASENSTMEQLVEHVEMIRRDLNFSIPALRRFVRRLKEEALREDVEDSDESMEQFAKAGRSGRARDGVVEAMRRKLYAGALDANDTAKAMEVFKVMKQEQKEDRTLALEERRMALDEENAKQEWKRQESEDARSALRLLPKIMEILMSTEGTAEERLGKARNILATGGARLLVERNE
ncbi:MAG TPA: hypothetical protein VI282_11670 [Verrucomicrobiae bacterium]|jgi:hypothetical protein